MTTTVACLCGGVTFAQPGHPGAGPAPRRWTASWIAPPGAAPTTPGVYPTRSDAHAWGASPNIEFLRTVLGVDSAAPGFARVRIAPHLGALARVSGRVPHPKSFVDVALTREGDVLDARITLPAGVTGELVWKGKAYPLQPGEQKLGRGGSPSRP